MREYVIEDAFRDEVTRRGGLALKFTSQTMNGLPDRLVLLLGGKAAFGLHLGHGVIREVLPHGRGGS